MQDDGRSHVRAMVPRWRSLARTSRQELRSSRRATSLSANPSASLDKRLLAWRRDRSIVSAAEVVDAAATLGQPEAAIGPAKFLLDSGSDVAGGVLRAARRALGQVADSTELDLGNFGSAPDQQVQARINQLKDRLRSDPRDALVAIEIARLQTLSGQAKSARRYVDLAVRLQHNNRYILRSAARYFTFVEEPDLALHVLTNSDAIRSDPWIQAAEVATSDLCGKTPKWTHKAIATFTASTKQDVASSELALGLATLEHKAGGKRKLVRRLAENGLRNPTENAIAQAVWLERNAAIDVSSGVVLAERTDATEALAMKHYEDEEYLKCTQNAWRWVKDQPFSPRGYLLGACCASIQLHDHQQALNFCEAGLLVHRSQPLLLNCLMFSQTYMGYIHQAEATLSRLEGFSRDPQIGPFVDAGRGLLAYRRNDIVGGREHYLAAMKTASVNGDHSLALNALIYWLEQEVMSGSMNRDQWYFFKKSAQARIFKLSKERRHNLQRVWNARSKHVDSLFDRPDLFAASPAGLAPAASLALPI